MLGQKTKQFATERRTCDFFEQMALPQVTWFALGHVDRNWDTLTSNYAHTGLDTNE